MKNKKIYFLVESVIQVVLSIISILGADASRRAALSDLSHFPEAIRDRMISIYSSNSIFIVPNIICAIFGVIIFIIAFRDKLSSMKKVIIGFSIACLILSTNSILSLISIVNIIIASRIEANLERNEKKEIPSLDRVDTDLNSVIGGVLCLVIYFSQAFIPSDFGHIFKVVIPICFYLIVLGVCLFFFRNNLKRDISTFIKNYSAYIPYIFSRLGLIYILYIAASFICVFVFKQGVSVNQQAVEALPLWYSVPLATIWAPIVEEILFRGCIRRFIKNDTIFIIVSGVVFGLLHTVSEGTLFSVLVMMLPYAVLGGGFAYIYVKTNNILSNILCHSFHNSIVMLLLIVIKK